jgi:capsular exopolysaccharide synthesis family protein
LELREASDQQDIQAYLRVFKRRKLTITLVTILVVGLVLLYSLLKTPIYTATTQVLVPDQSAASVLQPTNAALQPAAASAQRALTDAQQFAQGGQTKAAVLKSLRYQPDVSVTASTTADVLIFSTSNSSKVEAAKNANAYAEAYIAANQANQISQYTGQVVALQTSISKLQTAVSSLPAHSQQRLAASSSITSLTQSLQELQATSQLVAQTGPSVITAARPPTSPSSPKPVRNGELALVLGLLLGIGLAFLRDRLDDKVKSVSDIGEASGGLPIIGTIPLVDSWKKGSVPHIAFAEDPNSNASEAYRTLRTSIQFLGIEDKQRVIGITSGTPDEGKSTAAANLAVSFGRAGQRAVVMSFDFRRPRLHQFFGLDNEVGATSVLLGQATLAEALQEVPGEPNLRVVSSGPVPPNPAEILSLDRVRQLIDVISTQAEVILLDCPPVLPVTDTLLISRLCDSMVVIAVAAVTKKADLRHTYELLNQVQAPVRGTILNRVPKRGAYAYGYGYGYGYGYTSSTNGSLSTVSASYPGTRETTEQDRTTAAASPADHAEHRDIGGEEAAVAAPRNGHLPGSPGRT